jgi:hypothetical protein
MNYDESDIEVVYRRGEWNSWKDIVHWLERGLSQDSQADNELSAAESQQLLQDFRQLDKRHEKFTQNPSAAFKALQKVSS